MSTDRETARVERISVARHPWSPAQYFAGLVGLLMTVVGGVAMARLLPTDSLTGETTTVIGMGFNIVMAAITLLLGLVFLAAAGRPAEGRAGMISLGAALLALGNRRSSSSLMSSVESSGSIRPAVWCIQSSEPLPAIAGIASPTMVTRRAVAERKMEDDEVIHVT